MLTLPLPALELELVLALAPAEAVRSRTLFARCPLDAKMMMMMEHLRPSCAS